MPQTAHVMPEPELIAHQSVPKLFQLILQKQIFDPTLKET